MRAESPLAVVAAALLVVVGGRCAFMSAPACLLCYTRRQDCDGSAHGEATAEPSPAPDAGAPDELSGAPSPDETGEAYDTESVDAGEP